MGKLELCKIQVPCQLFVLKTSHLVVKIYSPSHLFSAYTTHSPTELWSLKRSAIKQSYYNTKLTLFECLNSL